MASELCRDYEEWKGLQLDFFFFFFFYNHPEYIEKVIKLIVKAKYRNIKKKIHVEKQKERKKTNLLQKKNN
jgi:hypothetical protein